MRQHPHGKENPSSSPPRESLCNVTVLNRFSCSSLSLSNPRGFLQRHFQLVFPLYSAWSVVACHLLLLLLLRFSCLPTSKPADNLESGRKRFPYPPVSCGLESRKKTELKGGKGKERKDSKEERKERTGWWWVVVVVTAAAAAVEESKEEVINTLVVIYFGWSNLEAGS